MGVSIRSKNGRLHLDFYYQKVRCREFTGLVDTKLNRRALERKAKLIELEMGLRTFDYGDHFPDGSKLHIFCLENVNTAHNSVPTYQDYAWSWFNENGARLAESTRRPYHSALKSHLIPWFGHLRLDQIQTGGDSPRTVRKFKAYLESKDYSPKHIRNILALFRTQLQQALVDGIISEDPTERIVLPIGRREKINPFRLEEISLVLEAIKKPHDNYFNVAFGTGMSPHEQIALTWDKIDFRRKKILVDRGRVLGEEKETKNKHREREIDMLSHVEAALNCQKEVTWSRDGYVFTNFQGNPLETNNLRRRIWYPGLKKAGLRLRTMKQTRHTFATLMLGTGENPSWVAQMLGHSSPQTTFRIYHGFIPNLTRKDGSAFMAVWETIKQPLN